MDEGRDSCSTVFLDNKTKIKKAKQMQPMLVSQFNADITTGIGSSMTSEKWDLC